jgi:glycosyltransferase involved in cell wall biosynthesis
LCNSWQKNFVIKFSPLLNIWFFPKWYLNKTDPQLGVFIQKHARAIALRNRVSVLYVHSTEGLSEEFETETKSANNFSETIIYFRKSNGLLSKPVNFIRYLKAFRKGIIQIRQKSGRPDVILAYILLRPALLASFYANKFNIPFIISEQWSGYVTGKFSKRPLLIRKFTRSIVKKANALTCVSKFLIEGMIANRIINANTFITPNCIEINSFNTNNKNDKTYILLVADLVDEIKNISGVIRMVANVREEKQFELHIVGHGRDEEMLKALVDDLNLNDIVFFEGIKTNKQVYEYLNRCNFLVMNSRFETFSLICAEAMSCGKPVLATRCGGPDDFVTPETGILIEPGNDKELQSEFLKMINSSDEYDPEKIIAHAHQMFSAEVVSETFEKVFNSVVKHR